MAELQCNHWRRDSITNMPSDVVVFGQHSALQSSTFFWNFQKCWKIQKSYKIFQNLENSKNFEKFKNFGKCKKVYDKITKPILKNSKKVYDITMAELKCNHWRRDTLTNITSNVVAFCHLSSHQSSTFFEIFKNLEKFENC